MSEKDTFPGSATGHSLFNESLVREGFLKFFVSLLKDYKQYLIYGNSDNPDPLVKFQFEPFIKSECKRCVLFLFLLLDILAQLYVNLIRRSSGGLAAVSAADDRHAGLFAVH